jgi:hypothetical protein
MKDKNVWITQDIKISCKHKSSLYAFTKNSDDTKTKAQYIKHCTVRTGIGFNYFGSGVLVSEQQWRQAFPSLRW